MAKRRELTIIPVRSRIRCELRDTAMSEYQCYEFRAIDRLLTEKEIDELGKLSSRAEITSTSFTNTYLTAISGAIPRRSWIAISTRSSTTRTGGRGG